MLELLTCSLLGFDVYAAYLHYTFGQHLAVFFGRKLSITSLAESNLQSTTINFKKSVVVQLESLSHTCFRKTVHFTWIQWRQKIRPLFVRWPPPLLPHRGWGRKTLSFAEQLFQLYFLLKMSFLVWREKKYKIKAYSAVLQQQERTKTTVAYSCLLWLTNRKPGLKYCEPMGE